MQNIVNENDEKGLGILVRTSSDQKPKLIIEAAHAYTCDEVNEEHVKGAAIGGHLSRLFSAIGYDVTNVLFIDDYNPKFEGKPEILNISEYLEIIAEKGYIPDKIFYESQMISGVEKVLQKLDNNRLLYSHGKNLYFPKGKGANGSGIYLVEDGKYKCALLDSVFTLQKLEMGDVVFNVLEKKWKSQQKNMKKLVDGVLGKGYSSSNIFNHFFHVNGSEKYGMPTKIRENSLISNIEKIMQLASALEDLSEGFDTSMVHRKK